MHVVQSAVMLSQVVRLSVRNVDDVEKILLLLLLLLDVPWAYVLG